MKCPMTSSRWLTMCSMHLLLMRETRARAAIETESTDSKSHAAESQSHMTTVEATHRRQVSCPTRTIILVRANQSLHFPMNAERQARNLGFEIGLYVGLASLVVILAGLLLYCITCIQGTKKRHKPVRRYNKPATIIIKPAIVKSHQQHTRVMRPAEPVHPTVLDDYETHSLTMYIPPED